MLSSASDYKFVNATPVADRIHGNVMPVLQPTASPAVAYFENYLYILEAYYERYNPESAGDNNIAVPPRTISHGNMYALNIGSQSLSASNTTMRGPLLGYGNDATYYVSPDTTCPSNHVNTGYTEDSTYRIYDFMQNWINPCAEEKAPYYAMRPSYSNTKLWSDFIRVKFWEFEHMNKLLIPLRLGSFATKWVHQTLKSDGSVNYEYEVGLTNSTESYIRGYSTTSQGGSTITYQLFKSVITYRDSFFTFPYATNAVLIWKMGVSAMGGESSETQKYVWATKQLSITNGAIQIPAGLIETLCDEACNIVGRPMNSTLTLYPCYLLVDFEFPARLDGITWNWQPTYT